MIPFLAPILLIAGAVQRPQASPDDIALAADHAKVSLELYRRLDDAPGNLFFSPFSVLRALALAREGAAGETALELDRVLRYPAALGEDYVSTSRALMAPQVGRAESRHAAYALELATSMWGRRGAPFAADYLQRLRAGFGAELRQVDFTRPDEARSAINAWASAGTKGRVPQIVPPGFLTPDTRLVLVDTIFFKAAWDEAFEALATKSEPFTLPDGKLAPVPTMHRSGEYAYGESELAQVLELPYERNAMSLVVVLPKRADGLADTAAREDVAQWTAPLERRRVEVALPKFRVTWGRDLKHALVELGLERPFDPSRADFSRILPEPLCFDAVLHQAFVAVDEVGTEAAAATAVVLTLGAPAPEARTPVVFRADHPFLFFVRHRATGAVLFLGRIDEPSSG